MILRRLRYRKASKKESKWAWIKNLQNIAQTLTKVFWHQEIQPFLIDSLRQVKTLMARSHTHNPCFLHRKWNSLMMWAAWANLAWGVAHLCQIRSRPSTLSSSRRHYYEIRNRLRLMLVLWMSCNNNRLSPDFRVWHHQKEFSCSTPKRLDRASC